MNPQPGRFAAAQSQGLGVISFAVAIILGTAVDGFAGGQAPELAKPEEGPSAVSPALRSTGPRPGDDLTLQQSGLSDRFQRLENLLLRMADFDQAENPHRAELLKKAYALSREKRMRVQFEELVTLLSKEEFGPAGDHQRLLKSDLDALLKLLLSEDQSDRNRNQQGRVREYIREIERISRLQRGLRGRTESDLAQGLTQEEQELADRTEALDDSIEQNELPPKEPDATEPPMEPASTPSDPKAAPAERPPTPADPSPESPEPTPPSDAAPTPSTPSEPSESPSENPSSTPSEPSAPTDPSSTPSEPSAESSSESSAPPPADDFPGRKQIREAQEAMRQAARELEQAKQEKAVERQRAAERALAEAKAQLEQILRQMREEEIERVLTQLETRFRRMLEMQVEVQTNTIRLEANVTDDRAREIEAGKLSFAQRRIVAEADRALVLLREEGSSIAFPETVRQLRVDMEQIADRLGRGLVEEITQGLEDDVIASLGELIESLRQAQQDQDKRQQQAEGAPSPSGEDEQSLLDKIAELKMIKALQIRINKRTTRYAQLLANLDDQIGQAEDPELRSALSRLAEREAALQKITRETVLGKPQ